MTAEFCDDKCQSNCDQPGSGGSGGDVQSRIMGYYEAWAHDRTCSGMTFDNIPAGSLTVSRHPYMLLFGYRVFGALPERPSSIRKSSRLPD